MFYESIKDDEPLAEGYHQGCDSSAFLYVKNAQFNVFITIGVVCYNTTKDTNGLITETSKDTVTVNGVTWDTNDEYEIYCTDTKDKTLSTFAVSEVYGRKLTQKFTKDEKDSSDDLFGPGQPTRN